MRPVMTTVQNCTRVHDLSKVFNVIVNQLEYGRAYK